MRRAYLHIARTILALFCAGGVLLPVVHQIQHGLLQIADVKAREGSTHKHPDYDAFCDENKHLQDSDFTCILCSYSVAGHSGLKPIFDKKNAHVFAGAIDQIPSVASRAHLSIRGPPVAGLYRTGMGLTTLDLT